MTDEAAVVETEGVEPEEELEPTEASEPEGEQAEPEVPEVPPEKKPRGVGKRIQELIRQRDEYKELVDRLSVKPAEEPKQEPLKQLADFGYDEAKYAEYMLDVVAKRAEQAAEKVVTTKAEQVQAKQEAERTDREFRSKEAKFAKTVQDYEDVVYSDDLTISEDVARIIKSLDEGPEVAYYLGKNPDIADDLSHLPPYLAGVEVGRIATRLAAEKQKAGKAVSSAPAPVPKLEGREPGKQIAPSEPDSDKLSMKEWLRRRNKQLAKK